MCALNTNKTKTSIVEGNIGAGKTTFLNHLLRYANAEILFEPLEKWSRKMVISISKLRAAHTTPTTFNCLGKRHKNHGTIYLQYAVLFWRSTAVGR